MSDQNYGAEREAGLSRAGGWTKLGWVTERLLAWMLALLLLRSAFVHQGNPYYFLSTVYSYELTGIEISRWAAMIIPCSQMIIAICLLTRWCLKEAYFFSCFLFAVFFGVQVMTLSRGLKISCGCFGAAESLQVGARTLVSSGLAAFASAAGWLSQAIRGWRTLVSSS